MEAQPRLFKWLLGAIILSLLCGFGKSIAARNVYENRQLQLTALTKCLNDLTDLDRSVQAAKIRHPKYTDGLSVGNLLQAVKVEKWALEHSNSTPDPRPVVRATGHARRVAALLTGQYASIKATINELDEALNSYVDVGEKINVYALNTTDRINDYVGQGYFKHHFADAQLLVGQLDEKVSYVKGLMKVNGSDGRPDYLLIYRTGLSAKVISTQSLSLTNRAPRLHQSVSDYAQSAARTISTLPATFVRAYDAATRIEAYTAYRSKGYSSGLKSWATEINNNYSSNLTEVRRLNSMDVQDFNGANTLLEKVRSGLDKVDRYLNAVLAFDRQVENAVDSLQNHRYQISNAIQAAHLHIVQWQSENDQSTAIATLNRARNDYATAKLKESTDPILACEYYESAQREASQAYSQVDTYVPPPPTSSSNDSSWSSSGSSGSSGGFGGSSDYGGSSSSSSSMGGSYGGPSGGSYGDGG